MTIPSHKLSTLKEQNRKLKAKRADLTAQIADVDRQLTDNEARILEAVLQGDDTPEPDAQKSPGERLLDLLRDNPHRKQSWYAERLYGDPKATGNVSSLLDYLKKTGKARSVGHGKWEVTDMD